MPTYTAPVDDVTFLLTDVFRFDNYANLPGFADASADVREAILTEAAKFSEQVLQPLNRTADLEGCTRMMMVGSPRPRASKMHSSSWPMAAGSVCRRPRSSADRDCPRCCRRWSTNS